MNRTVLRELETKMKKMIKHSLLMLITIAGFQLTGCAASHGYNEMGSGHSFAMEASAVEPNSMMRSQPQLSKMHSDVNEQERKLIKRSWLTLRVKDLVEAEAQAKGIVENKTGYIQNTNGDRGKSFNLSIRVPQDQYVPTLVELRKVGEVISENENVQDVTTEFIDNQARLDNLYKLRERIQLLLNRADRIEDLLKIERELNRTQSEIDRLEGRMKYLKGQVNYASIELTVEKQKTYGPLGYFFMGIFWGVEKLFVWDQ